MKPTAKTLIEHFPGLVARLRGGDAATFTAALDVREVAVGDVLVREGEKSGTLYLLCDGEALVTISVASSARELGRVGPGAMLGELSFLDGDATTAKITAATPLTLFVLSRAKFNELLTTKPAIASALLHGISETLAPRVRFATERVQALGAVPTTTATPAAAPTILDSVRRLFGIGKA